MDSFHENDNVLTQELPHEFNNRKAVVMHDTGVGVLIKFKDIRTVRVKGIHIDRIWVERDNLKKIDGTKVELPRAVILLV